MKSYFTRAAGMVAVAFVLLWSCQREMVLDESNPGLQATVGYTDCGVSSQAGLLEADYNPYVDICNNGPCTTTTPWGVVTYTKTMNSLGTQANLHIDVALAQGIYAEFYNFQLTTPGGIVTVNGVPSFLPSGTVLNPVRNQFNFDVTIATGEDCFDWALAVGVVKTDIFGSVIGRTTVYATNGNTAGAPLYVSSCYNACSLPTSTSTQGVCQGCKAAVTVTFSGCATVDVSSCRTIQQVVIVYDDCTREYHDNLTGTSYNFQTTGAPISHVYVRSGCRGNQAPGSQDNLDTNGFVYNNVMRLRFDGPCVNGACQ